MGKYHGMGAGNGSELAGDQAPIMGAQQPPVALATDAHLSGPPGCSRVGAVTVRSPGSQGWAVSVQVPEVLGWGAGGSLRKLDGLRVAGPQQDSPPHPSKLIDLIPFMVIFPLQRI